MVANVPEALQNRGARWWKHGNTDFGTALNKAQWHESPGGLSLTNILSNSKVRGLSRLLATTAVVATAFVASALLVARPASATPGGLTFYPSTDIYGKGNFHFDADLFTRNLNQNALISNGISVGAGPDRDGVFGRSEFGLDYFSGGSALSNSISADNRVFLNAKTQLYNNEASATRVVAGVFGLGKKGNLGTGNTSFPPNVAYLLGSKNFSFGRVHLGVAQALASRSTIATPDGGDDRTFLQLGYDKLFADGKFQFTFDAYTGKSAYSVAAPGLIYYFNNRASFQVGYVRFNDKSVLPSRDQAYLAFDYNFGGGNDDIPNPSDESQTKGADVPASPSTPTPTP